MMQSEVWLRLNQVCERLACKPSHVYGLVARGELAKPLKLSHKHAVWRDSDVAAFQQKHIAAQRETHQQ